MKIDRMTAMLIKYNGDEIIPSSYGPTDNGKYASWISLYKDGRPHIDPLLESDPVYESTEDAEASARAAIDEIRGWDTV
jgi:hypothetical protein